MKLNFCLLISILILPLASKAQNWHPMRYGPDYGFVGDTTQSSGLGMNTWVLRVNSKTPTATPGDTLFGFNFTLKNADSAAYPLPASCLDSTWHSYLAEYYLMPGNLFGAAYRLRPDALVFYKRGYGPNPDSCRLPFRPALGDTFLFSAGMKGVLTQQFRTDSSHLGWDTTNIYHIGQHWIELSRNQGLKLAFAWGGPLNGISPNGHLYRRIVPALGIGTHPVALEDFYPYQPGDTLGYYKTYLWTLPATPRPPDVQTRYRVLSRQMSGDTLIIGMRGQSYSEVLYSNPRSWTTNGPGTGLYKTLLTGDFRDSLVLATDDIGKMAIPLGYLSAQWQPKGEVYMTLGTRYLSDNKPVMQLTGNYQPVDVGTCPYRGYGYLIDAGTTAWVGAGTGWLSTYIGSFSGISTSLTGYCRANDTTCRLAAILVGGKDSIEPRLLGFAPNPATSIVSVQFSSPGARPTVVAVDALGRSTALPYTRTETGARVEVSRLPKGLYRLRVLAGTAAWMGSFVKE